MEATQASEIYYISHGIDKSHEIVPLNPLIKSNPSIEVLHKGFMPSSEVYIRNLNKENNINKIQHS